MKHRSSQKSSCPMRCMKRQRCLDGKVGEVGMTLEVIGAIAISSMIWNIFNLIKICLLENKISYQKGQIEALIRREPTQTNAKNNALDVR